MGRLGNILFEVASTIGVAKKLGIEYAFNEYPKWPFTSTLPVTNKFPNHRLNEYPNMGFRDEVYNQGRNFTIEGYFQCPKYFEDIKHDLIQNIFVFSSITEKEILKKYQLALRLDPVSFHVRRTDYVSQGWYTGDHWYLSRMSELEGKLVLVFSDDIHYCMELFKDFKNILYVHEDEVNSLCLMSKCKHHVISNSTFSYWGAFLSQSDYVIYPDRFDVINNGACTFPNKDFYPVNWLMK